MNFVSSTVFVSIRQTSERESIHVKLGLDGRDDSRRFGKS